MCVVSTLKVAERLRFLRMSGIPRRGPINEARLPSGAVGAAVIRTRAGSCRQGRRLATSFQTRRVEFWACDLTDASSFWPTSQPGAPVSDPARMQKFKQCRVPRPASSWGNTRMRPLRSVDVDEREFLPLLPRRWSREAGEMSFKLLPHTTPA